MPGSFKVRKKAVFLNRLALWTCTLFDSKIKRLGTEANIFSSDKNSRTLTEAADTAMIAMDCRSYNIATPLSEQNRHEAGGIPFSAANYISVNGVQRSAVNHNEEKWY